MKVIDAQGQTKQVSPPRFLGVVLISAASYDVLDTDDIIFTDSTSNAVTINLHAPSTQRRTMLAVKRVSSGANDVTIDAPGTAKIDGAETVTLGAQYEGVILVSNGSHWFIAARIV